MLSPSTNYVCYLVFKLSENCRGLHCPVKVRDLQQRKSKEAKILYFRSPTPLNQHDDDCVPEEREDGLMEVNVWKFNSMHRKRNHLQKLKERMGAETFVEIILATIFRPIGVFLRYGCGVAPIIKLEEVVTTCEENEDAILDRKVKLYGFDKDGNHWKFLKHKQTRKVLIPTMSVEEHARNDKSCVWHATVFSDGEIKDELFCIRFGSTDNRFYTKYGGQFL
ncbi:hypothetical protein L6452_43437 [Arctium lappa]|uniref:Uncharacterized protein n=1 Tax=Arctium lappa TaxID=4217 RepID=A0ACB8XCX6_ARCLA|nr:hypothetical protein L6452_43437 [Arctium lappa]